MFSLNIGDTSKYGKYYNPYSSREGIPWILYPTKIRIMSRIMSRIMRPMIVLSFVSMGSDRIYTCIYP